MSEFVIAEKQDLVDIADAIRAKTGSTDTLALDEMPLIIADIKTGVELNFTVVGGTTQPTNPVENTIWINTDTTITEWAIVSSTQTPTSPVEGMVWILDEVSSGGEFNALTENSLQVYPGLAKQYISGAWVTKSSKIYQNGSWVSPFTATIKVTYPKGTCTCTLGSTTYSHSGGGTATFTVEESGTWTVTTKYESCSKSSTATITTDKQTVALSLSPATWFYNEGNECTSLTGGWGKMSTTNIYALVGESGKCYNTGTVTENATNIYLNNTTTSMAATATASKVNLSDIKTLYIKAYSSHSSGCEIHAMTATSNNYWQHVTASSKTLGSGTVTTAFDVSSLSSNYLAVRAYAGYNSAARTCYVYEIYGA